MMMVTAAALLAACGEGEEETAVEEEVEAQETNEEPEEELEVVEEENEEDEEEDEEEIESLQALEDIDEDEDEDEEEETLEVSEREEDPDAEPHIMDSGVVPQFVERQAGINAETDEVYSLLDDYYEYNPEYDEHIVYSYQMMYLLSDEEVRPVMMIENYWSVALANVHVELTVETTEGDVLIDGEELFLSYDEVGVIESGQAIPYFPALEATEENIEILEAIHENPSIFRCTYRIIHAEEFDSGAEYTDSGYEATGTIDALRPIDDDSFEVISPR